ncbi:Adenosylhomocysteinase [Rubrivivax sp. A210]|nr:Adenosylhomocysteinase [Rubrivivax sp. A210]
MRWRSPGARATASPRLRHRRRGRPPVVPGRRRARGRVADALRTAPAGRLSPRRLGPRRGPQGQETAAAVANSTKAAAERPRACRIVLDRQTG